MISLMWYTLKNAVSAEYEMGKRRNINLNFNHKFGYLAAIFLCVHMTWWPCLRFLDSSPCCDIWNSSTKLGSVTWSTSRMKGSKIHLGLSKLIITHYKKKTHLWVSSDAYQCSAISINPPKRLNAYCSLSNAHWWVLASRLLTTDLHCFCFIMERLW